MNVNMVQNFYNYKKKIPLKCFFHNYKYLEADKRSLMLFTSLFNVLTSYLN